MLSCARSFDRALVMLMANHSARTVTARPVGVRVGTKAGNPDRPQAGSRELVGGHPLQPDGIAGMMPKSAAAFSLAPNDRGRCP